MVQHDVMPLGMKAMGIFHDEIWKKDPKTGLLLLDHVTPKRRNVLTIGMGRMLSALLSDDPTLVSGILFHAIGTDNTAEKRTDEQLAVEAARLAPDSVSFIKAGQGQAQSGTTTTIVDTVSRFEPDDFFNARTVEITAGTNNGESRTVSDYDQATGLITVSAPFTSPIDSTSVYEFTPIVDAGPTTAVRVKTTYPNGIVSDPFNGITWKEQGLFAGNATSALNSGQMVNRLTHPDIAKDTSFQVIRFVDLIFTV